MRGRLALAVAIQGSYLGASAAFNGGDAHAQMVSRLEELATVDDGDDEQYDEDPSKVIQMMAARGEIQYNRVRTSDAPQD